MSGPITTVRARHPAVDEHASVTGDRSGRYPAQMRSTRHRSSAPGIAMLVALAAALVGCVGGPGPSSLASEGSGGESAPPSLAPASAPVESGSPATPAQTEDLPTEPPDSEAPPPESVAPSDSPDPAGGAAAACSGTDNNRDFYADAANALDFPVYCPVLPRGWFVDEGSYQLRNGGLLRITYKGPAGAGLELIERGPCGAGDDCIPSGTEEGQASFGGLPAAVVALDDGGLAVVAEDVGNGRWWIIGRGVEEQALTKIASDLTRVGG